MGRIQSSVGLVTGIPIQQTVDQLIALQARPRDRLVARQKVLGAEQAAVTDLTALTLGVQFALRRLKNIELFAGRKVASSHPSLLTATLAAASVPGTYAFVPLRAAQTHQALSSGLAARDASLGGGAFFVRFGGHVDPGLSLADLNGGDGVARGRIRITDRSGASAVIDLRYVQTIDDVLAAINAADEIAVEARAGSDGLILRDTSGGSGNLRVQEVSSGTTAADLGLAGINVAADEAAGTSLVRLFAGFSLNQVRDGAGLSLRPELPDLAVSFQDGSTLEIDLDPLGDPSPRTLGELLNRLNAADPERLAAQISSDGKRIELKDLTTGGGTFAVTSPLGGTLAEELGLTGAATGGVITGSRLISGLKTTLLGSLAGGQGLAALGGIQLTDRSGASATVDLSAAETLADAIEAINAAGVGISAGYNSARNGLALTDTTGATTSNLVIADADGTSTATKLGLAANVAATAVNSGSLSRQVVSRNTLLSDYNAGRGVSLGTILVTDSAGAVASVNLKALVPKAIGDVIDAINGLSVGVKATINASGDGIALIDTAGGSGTLSVSDVGAGRAASDLRIAGSGQATMIGGQPAQIIDGSTTVKIALEAEDTLDDLVAKLNGLSAGFTAGVFHDGGGSLPYRLSLLSGVAGKAGEMLIDGSELGLTFRDVTPAQNALLQIGGGSAAGILVSSASGVFKDVQPGLSATLLNSSTDTVTVTVQQTVDDVASALQLFVDQYNKLRDKLATYTAFNPRAGTKGTLFASAEALRLDSDLARAITGRHFNDGPIRSLAELGIGIDDLGKLSLDRTKLQARFDADSQAVTEFFADVDRGFAVKVDAILEALVGRNQSLLVNRVAALQRQMELFGERIDAVSARLERSRERLRSQFFRLEEVVSRIQNNLTAINQIRFIEPILTSSRS
jgi:flagellar hook-associated protein 2